LPHSGFMCPLSLPIIYERGYIHQNTLFIFTFNKHNRGFIYGFHIYKYFNISVQDSETHHLYKWLTLFVCHCPCYDQFHNCFTQLTVHVKCNTQATITINSEEITKLLHICFQIGFSFCLTYVAPTVQCLTATKKLHGHSGRRDA